MTMDKKADKLLLDMRDDHKELLLDILRANIPELEVWAFGSRVKWTSREASDLDLALRNPGNPETPIDLETIGGLKEILDESDLPFMVDILDWATLSEKFRKVIEREYVVIQEPGRKETQKKEWKKYKLKDICIKIGSGATPRGGKESYLDNGPYALIRSQNVLDFHFSYDGLAYIDDNQAKQLDNVNIESDDILLNITGDSVARVCQVPEEIKNARVNQHVAIIRTNKEIINHCYLKYYLLNPSFKNYMLSLASVGGTRNALTKGMIEDFEVYIPNLPTQTRIASILSALDEKIELNRQTNATLEAIAQAIFKEWFVDFRFPGTDGEMEESELGLIPKGWREGHIGDLFELQRGFDLPTASRNEGIYPVITASGYNGYHDEFKVKAPGVTTGRSGILGNVFYVQEDFWPLNTSLYVKEFKIAPPIYSYYILKEMDLKSLNGGSAVPTLNRNEVHKLAVIIPPRSLLHKFDYLIKPIFEIIFSNEQQAKTLSQIRDSLLPKLMNGEIEV